MITLSYSTINYCLQPENSHNWLNKMMGAKVPDNEFFKNGHRLHAIIQGHLSGKTPDERLSHLTHKFPIVEEVDFDKRCEFIIPINEKFQVRGFVDAKDPANLKLGEIKTAGKMWTIGQFQNSMQKKVYALGHPEYKTMVGITALSDDSQWLKEKVKAYPIPLTQRDRDEALKWILEAIAVIEKGEFNGGLDDNGKCALRFCNFGENCQFK
mgnify:CR=1 FL=1